jgi:tRNA A-37 threonylcarbamoyl transferase component Bud32
MTTQPEVLSRLTRALEGRYRIEGELGAGGMATVYRAHDVKHERRVAIKVLHADLSAVIGGDRFLAEIRTTAALQHPHILPLFDSGTADGLLFYVMPLVEGDTLRDRLNKDKQLSIPEALRIATEVAGALDYAHRHNVIHRDIKPENVLLQDGSAVVADFGIALAVHHAGEQRMTQTGLSLGTPQYMSPEQAMGEKNVDKRADVYALGAVLYEMLTGEPPFSGATVQAIVAKVLTERPGKPSAVRDTIPPHVEATVLTALAKLPADRFATAAQFAEALARPEATSSYVTMTAARAAAVPPSNRALRALPWILAGLAAGAAIWMATRPKPVANEGPLVLADLGPVNGVDPAVVGTVRSLVFSPDGSKLAFLGIDSTRVPRLFVRSLNSLTIWPVPESQFGNSPAFSASGKTLAFSANGEIKVVEIGDSRPRSIYRSTAMPPLGAAGLVWDGDTAIFFVEHRGIYRVRPSGGAPERVVSPVSDSSVRYAAPAPIAGGTAFFVALQSPTGAGSPPLAVVNRGDSVPVRLGLNGTRPQLVRDSILLFLREGSIRAVVVDRRTYMPRGEPVVLSGSEMIHPLFQFAASPNGVVGFVVGSGTTEAELFLVERTGKQRLALTQRQAYRFPRFAPDGNRLAFGVSGSNGPSSGDIWVLNLRDNKSLRVTSDAVSYHPEWTADGRSIRMLRRDSVYQGTVHQTSADGTAPISPVFTEVNGIWEHVLLPGNRLLYRRDNPGSGRDILIADLADGKVTPLVATQFDEKGIALGPDSTWFAYSSNEGGAGVHDIYVRRTTPGSPRWRVSVGGGTEPRWIKTGEVFFRRGDSLFVSRVRTTGAEPLISQPAFVFYGEYVSTTFEPMWDVSPDGRQFAFVRYGSGVRLRTTVLLNWFGLMRNPGAP